MPENYHDREAILQEVGEIYQDLASRPLKRNCVNRAECCNFGLTGRMPMVTLGEALYTAKGVRAAGWKELPAKEDGLCPLLSSQGKCRAYATRPFGCRTHFCSSAGGPYSRTEVLDLIRRLEVIDAKLGGLGPRPLPAAVADCLVNWSARGKGVRR